jgi:hypothetical protein
MKVVECVKEINQTIEALLESPIVQSRPHVFGNELELFINRITDFTKTYLIYDLCEFDLTNSEQALKDAFCKNYSTIKTNDFINSLIILCDTLEPYRVNFQDKTKLNPAFVASMPGVSWMPLSDAKISSLDFKMIMAEAPGESTVRFLMLILHALFDASFKLWKTVSTADIDIDRFTVIIMDNLQAIKKIPALSRCDKAFARLEKSIGLLKDNFGEYYKSVLTTKDPTMLVQEYILDVSKNSAPDPATMRQFTTIMNYYQKNQSGMPKNPKIQSALNSISANFAKIERGTTNLGKKKDPELEAEIDKLVDCMSGIPRKEEDV